MSNRKSSFLQKFTPLPVTLYQTIQQLQRHYHKLRATLEIRFFEKIGFLYVGTHKSFNI